MHNFKATPISFSDGLMKDDGMTPIWLVGFLATLVGVGIGGILAWLVNGFKKSIGTIYAICAGLILGLISFEIAPEAIGLGDWVIFSLGFLAGVLLFKSIHKGVHKKANHSTGLHGNSTKRVGLFLVFIISVHNLPMGAVLGTGEQMDVNNALLQALILHNIPEGMILFTPFIITGFTVRRLFSLSFLVAIPVAVGGILGESIGMQNTSLWAFLISFTVGMIYMIAVKEILVESIKYSSNRYSLFVAFISFCLMGAFLLFA
ncbi:ZIP family metal transporter [Filibacter tadaridae]|uniref:Zinc transporter ZupT n=1 Tax=Filibacter tadaridae TaxID=2483811 RepID=A0A3P5XDA9_9BACL|nr:ZIP family metal transporter [Filibacter tadaridae]VDC25514.1 zinc transporter ZupT [Filibacter tadaridae]